MLKEVPFALGLERFLTLYLLVVRTACLRQKKKKDYAKAERFGKMINSGGLSFMSRIVMNVLAVAVAVENSRRGLD